MDEGGRPHQFNDYKYCCLIADFRVLADDWIAGMVIVGFNTGMLESSIVFLWSPTLNKLHVQQRKDA